MAMNLVDRPFPQDPFHAHRRTGGAMASGAVHLIAVMTLIALFRAIPEKAASDPTSTVIPPFVFLPHENPGGGREGGGDRSILAPRRTREVGSDRASTPQATQPSDTITNDPPEEVAPLPVKPTGDASTPLAGAISGDPASTALGPGDRGAGSAPGDDRGIGTKPGNTFGNAFGPGNGVTTPTVITQVKPHYTADAMRLRIQGSVWIECVVMPDGSVGDARVTRSLDSRFGLDDEAIAAAKQWRFRPGTLNGKPVPVVVSIELMFSVR